MKRESYEAKALKLLAQAERFQRHEAARQLVAERLERETNDAERWQLSEEQFLGRAVELMQRRDRARRKAQVAEAAANALRRDHRREEERRRKNERARARYKERRRSEPPRLEKRTGMHALAIEVDSTAYRAVKAEAFRRHNPIPRIVGEILSDTLRSRDRSSAPQASRWRRTGEGRRANQHTRIDVDNETWQAVRIESLESGLTMARWIGVALEAWARQEPPTRSRRSASGDR